MGKIFEFNGKRNGSYIDSVSGAVGVNTNGEIARTDKGLAYRCDGSAEVNYDDVLTVLGGDFSASVWIRSGDKTGDDIAPLGSDASSFQPFRIRSNNWYGYWTDGSNPSSLNTTVPITDNLWHCLLATCDKDGKVNCYLDGVLRYSISNSTTGDIDVSDLRIGLSGISDYFVGDVAYGAIWDHILTEKERAKLYKEFLDASPITRTIR